MDPTTLTAIGSALATLAALIRYRWKLDAVKHALGDERGVEAVDAVARAMHPTTTAARRYVRRRAAVKKKPPSIRRAS